MFSTPSFLLFLFLPLAVFAGGSGVIPQFSFDASSGESMVLYVSNVSHDAVSVRVSFFNKDGSLVGPSFVALENTGRGSIGAFTGQSSASFGLSPKTTARLILSAPLQYGYGVIEWSQDSTVTDVLIASAQVFNSGNVVIPIAVNGGQVF